MRRSALVPLAVAVVIAGCGGGDDKEHDAFVASANGICRQHSRELRALAPPQSYQQLLGYVDDLERLTTKRLVALRKLTPPGDDADDFGRMLAELEHTEGLFPQLHEAATIGQPAQVREVLEQAKASDARAGEIGASLGLDDC